MLPNGTPGWLALILVGVTTGLAGCAFTDIPLDMPVSGLPVPLTGGKGRQVIVQAPFTDQRRHPERCGMQKNGYNQDTANVVCQTPPAAWIAGVLADELRAAGFTVLAPDAAHRPGALQVGGALLELFVEPMAQGFSARCECDLEVRLDATSDTGLRATRLFFGKGVWQGFSGVTAPFQVSIKSATEEVLREMVQGIIELMNRYPELGALPRSPGIARRGTPCVS